MKMICSVVHQRHKRDDLTDPTFIKVLEDSYKYQDLYISVRIFPKVTGAKALYNDLFQFNLPYNTGKVSLYVNDSCTVAKFPMQIRRVNHHGRTHGINMIQLVKRRT